MHDANSSIRSDNQPVSTHANQRIQEGISRRPSQRVRPQTIRRSRRVPPKRSPSSAPKRR